MTELSPRARALIEAACQAPRPRPSPAVRARLKATVRVRVAATPGLSLTTMIGGGAVAAALLAAGLVLAPAARRDTAPEDQAPLVTPPAAASARTGTSVRPSVEGVAEPGDPRTAAAAPGPEAAGTGPARVPRPRAATKHRSTAPRPAQAPARGSSLAAEVALIAAADDAITRRDFGAARSALERHHRDHPHGALVPDRELLERLIDCAVTPGAQSRARARAVAARTSARTALTRLRAGCGLEPGDDEGPATP